MSVEESFVRVDIPLAARRALDRRLVCEQLWCVRITANATSLDTCHSPVEVFNLRDGEGGQNNVLSGRAGYCAYRNIPLTKVSVSNNSEDL